MKQAPAADALRALRRVDRGITRSDFVRAANIDALRVAG